MASADQSPIVTINDVAKLQRDVSSLYLNPKYSDFSFLTDGEKIPGHTAVVGVRSGYFEQLIDDMKGTDTISINVSTPSTFKKLLKYIYTGTITLDTSETDPFLDLMSLAHQYDLKELSAPLAKKIQNSINTKNVYSTLNIASFNNMDELKNVCLKFLEDHIEELVLKTDYLNLNQAAMVSLLQRDTLSLPEHKIFEMASNWRSKNNDIDDLVFSSVRFSHLSADEMLKTVWPTEILPCKKFVQYMSEVLDETPKSTGKRPQFLTDVNFATVQYKCELITGKNPANLFNGNRNQSFYSECPISDKNGITIKLGQPRFINYITFMLYSADASRHYKYYIETSVDQSNWKKIVDYSNYPCRSVQHLYFPPEFARYVRVVGVYGSANPNLHIIYIEAYYKTKDTPKFVDGILRPSQNMTHPDKHAYVIQGNNQVIINGSTSSSTWTEHNIGSGAITIELAQPCRLSNLKLQLWDGDQRIYKYFIDTSPDRIQWEMAWDRSNEPSKSYQYATFKERIVSFIRINGIFNSANKLLHSASKIARTLQRCLHLEWSPNKKIDKKIFERYKKLPLKKCTTQVTYVWIDGTGEHVRSKTRTFNSIPSSHKDCPNWDFDGSSTGFGTVTDSDFILCPIALYPDPIAQRNNKIVLCETYSYDGHPTKTNHRNKCLQALNMACGKEPWFGFEQEFILMDFNNRPFGWPWMDGEPAPPGPYYCGVGARRALGRDIIDSHYLCCLYAGIDFLGVNAEVTPSQWEFQTGPTLGIKAADDLWVARYLLWRVAEGYGVDVTLTPSLFPNWNGSGCHTNFSTKEMRDDGGYAHIEAAIKRLEARHSEHLAVYDPNGGADNKHRLTGAHETSSVDKFTWGVGDRSASIRVNKSVAVAKKGYLEDRRPGANADPYEVINMLIRSTVLGQEIN